MATKRKDTVLRYSLEDGVTNGLKSITKTLGEIGAGLLKITGIAAATTAALGAISGALTFRDSFKAAADFEQALARIRAATGATDAELARIKSSIEDTAAGAAKGVDEAAAAFETLAREGFSTADAINTLPAALNFATAAQLETAEAAGLLADTLDQYGESASDASRVTDSLAAAALKGGTDVGGLTAALREVAPVARTLGVGIEQAAAAVGLLAQNGIEGRKAGAALRGILNELADPASKFRAELQKLGITSTDFGTVVQQLAQRGQGAQAALTALGDRAGPALAAILRQGAPALREFVESLEASEGAAARAAGVINDNLSTAFAQFQRAIVDTGRLFLEPLLKPLTDEIQSAEAAIRGFAESQTFKDLSEAFRDIFIAGVQGLKQFVAEFDFSEATAKLKTFAADAKESTAGVASDLAAIAENVRAIANAVGGAIDAASFAYNEAKLLTAGVAEGFARVAGVAIPAADDLAESLADVAEKADIAASDSLGSLIERFTGVEVAAADVDAALAPVPAKFVTLTTSAAELEREFADLGPAAAAAGAALGAVGDQATETGQQASTAAGKVVEIATRLGELRNQITLLQSQGAGAEVLAPLTQQADALAASLQKAKTSAAEASATVTASQPPAAQALAETGKQAEATASSVSQVGEAAQQAGADAAEGATQTAGAASELFGLINALSQKYKAVSDGALEFFLAALKSTTRGVNSLEAFGEAIERADKATVAALANQKKQAEAIGLTLQTFAETGQDAFGRVGRSASYTVEQLEAMVRAAREGRSGFELLDQASLQGLIAQAEAARDKVAALAQAARDARAELEQINRDLQDEADRAAGNEEAIAERQFQAQLKRIRDLAAAGGTEAQLQAAQAERLAREAYARELARLRALREERRQSTDEFVADEDRKRAAVEATARAGQAAVPTAPRDAAPRPNGTTVREGSQINVILAGATLIGEPDEKTLEKLVQPIDKLLRRREALRR